MSFVWLEAISDKTTSELFLQEENESELGWSHPVRSTLQSPVQTNKNPFCYGNRKGLAFGVFYPNNISFLPPALF